MEIKLPSGHTAHLRDQFLRGDRRQARPGQKVIFGDGGIRHVDLPSDDEIIGRILRAVIVEWDVPQPLPRDAATDEIAQAILDQLPDDDYELLAQAVRPFFDKVMRAGGGEDPNSRSGATGTSGPGAQDGQGTLTI